MREATVLVRFRRETTMIKRCVRYSSAALIAVVAAVLALGLTTRRSAASDAAGEEERFANRTIKGHYGFNSSLGWLLPPAAPQAVPAAGMGRITFDGDGHCEVASVANFNGNVARLASSSCTYSVDANGMGTAEAIFPGAPIPGPVDVSFVIVDHGGEIRFLNTTFILGTFTARRQ
jgi:hypothetical protein